MPLHQFSQFVDGSRPARPRVVTEAFTRQHYQEIANILKAHKPTSGSVDAWNQLVDAFVTLFVRDNPNFNPDVFAKAVGR